jgi:hypothetical protein
MSDAVATPVKADRTTTAAHTAGRLPTTKPLNDPVSRFISSAPRFTQNLPGLLTDNFIPISFQLSHFVATNTLATLNFDDVLIFKEHRHKSVLQR